MVERTIWKRTCEQLEGNFAHRSPSVHVLAVITPIVGPRRDISCWPLSYRSFSLLLCPVLLPFRPYGGKNATSGASSRRGTRAVFHFGEKKWKERTNRLWLAGWRDHDHLPSSQRTLDEPLSFGCRWYTEADREYQSTSGDSHHHRTSECKKSARVRRAFPLDREIWHLQFAGHARGYGRRPQVYSLTEIFSKYYSRHCKFDLASVYGLYVVIRLRVSEEKWIVTTW